ncbi:hypothetical protein DYB25_007604 [Aphanomyces astaci]|uniref:AAA+ ATPase domain-containing protein n=1 Tax=Aphanomyces astaci TaxID=112090 RepID=A0A397BXQ2_APHAT|nr:hypothetical protein DYB25_007604 [Aphanomyces astaci]
MVSTAIPCSLLPFDPSAVSSSAVDAANSTFVRVSSKDKSYALILAYVATHLVSKDDHRSFEVRAGKKSYDSDSDNDDDDDDKTTSSIVVGFGLHRFTWQQHTLHCLRQSLGTPVGTREEAVRLENLVLMAPQLGNESILRAFVDAVVAASEATTDGFFSVYRWSHYEWCWNKVQSLQSRPMATVVLPALVKESIIDDVENFVTDECKAFYETHGIPYKRGYLFHGVPGSGKTSLIQALASHCNRHVCMLQISHPNLNDDYLQTIISRLPPRSILVLEDIDAAFTKDRKKKVEHSSLTFSGLLNALDGVGGHDGHIVVLTTNFRDQLDDALIRNGRVDVHVAFAHASPDQMADMFLAFYPRETRDRALAFADALVAALGPDRPLSTAALQHYFVTQRRSTADGAIANVDRVAIEIDARKKQAEEVEGEEEDGNEDDK